MITTRRIITVPTAKLFALSVLLLPLLCQADIKFKVNSPLNGIATVEQLITAVLSALIVIAIPIIVLFIVYAGFLYVTAQGNVQQVQQATRALTYAIIGAVLIIGAVALSGIIQGIVAAFKST